MSGPALSASLSAAGTARSGAECSRDAVGQQNLLWTYDMGIVLYWIHDRSPDRARTWTLIERSVAIIDHLVRLASRAPMRGPRKRVLELLESIGLRGDRTEAGEEQTRR